MELPLFRTVVEIPPSEHKITYSSNVMFIGSCFTEEIGGKMTQYLFRTDVNPFGVIYNPVSVANSLRLLLERREFTESDLEQRGSVWFSWYHHSRFSFPSKEQTLEAINTRLVHSADFLRKADFLFITFGTAWVYELKRTGQVVSNCHKLPQKLFRRRMLSVEEIVELYQELLQELWLHNPSLKIVFTLSPVRHWKDGAEGNLYSKSVLYVAIRKILELLPQVQYFPAYEIVMDELRDYRFYAEDMLHIAPAGVDYIWLRFGQTYFTESVRESMRQVEKILKAREHKPINRLTPEYLQFLNSTIEKIMILRKSNPNIQIEPVLEYFVQEKRQIEQELNHEQQAQQ